MLQITINPNGPAKLSFATFEYLGLPGPRNGANAEINGDLVLKFEDEAEAIVYSEQLEELSIALKDKSSVQNLAIGEMIMAVSNDEFVQTYLSEV